jgi:flagellar hook protein FlgE
MTQLSASSTTSAFQDGYASGTLTEVRMSSNGLMEGVATNGRSIPLAQLAIATFRNPSGLTRAGSNYYDTSLASGDAEIGTALSGDRGTVKSNYLERSNVDIALEFTQLITAQRGFSANARTITVTDEILQELTSLIR